MLSTLGLLVTLLFALFARDARVFVVLVFVFVFGVFWDVLWILLQRLRWERDWPAAFQIGSAIVEGIWLYLVLWVVGLPFVARGSLGFGLYLAQYFLVWLVTFIWVQGPMRTLFPRWRYNGGQLIP